MTCSDPECAAPAKKRGLCDKHYLRARRAGRLAELPPSRRGQRPRRPVVTGDRRPDMCRVIDCDARPFAQGLCRNCYLLLRSRGEIGTGQLARQKALNDRPACLVEGCEAPPRHTGLRTAHHHRKLKYGDPRFLPERTKNRFKPKQDRNGYLSVYVPDHPDARANGYLFEHRLVMERQIGRRLMPNETVHHKSGGRADNSPANLELWASSQPSGQRVTDLVEWAKRILAAYPPELIDRLK